MPKQIEFEGATHEFPDDFSDADIGKALNSLHPSVPGTGKLGPPPGIPDPRPAELGGTPSTRGMRNPRTGQRMNEGSGPLKALDLPVEGVGDIEHGVEQIAGAPVRGTASVPAPKYDNESTGSRVAGGLSKMVRGGMKMASPMLPGAAAAAPLGVAAGLSAGTAAQAGTEKVLDAAGAEPGYRDLAGDAAGIVTGGVVGRGAANGAASVPSPVRTAGKVAAGAALGGVSKTPILGKIVKGMYEGGKEAYGKAKEAADIEKLRADPATKDYYENVSVPKPVSAGPPPPPDPELVKYYEETSAPKPPPPPPPAKPAKPPVWAGFEPGGPPPVPQVVSPVKGNLPSGRTPGGIEAQTVPPPTVPPPGPPIPAPVPPPAPPPVPKIDPMRGVGLAPIGPKPPVVPEAPAPSIGVAKPPVPEGANAVVPPGGRVTMAKWPVEYDDFPNPGAAYAKDLRVVSALPEQGITPDVVESAVRSGDWKVLNDMVRNADAKSGKRHTPYDPSRVDPSLLTKRLSALVSTYRTELAKPKLPAQ